MSPNSSEGCWLQGKAMKAILIQLVAMKISVSSCSYEILSNLQLWFSPNQLVAMKIFQSSCQVVAMKISPTCSYDFPPIKSVNFKSYLTWLGFELKTIRKKTPLHALTNWAIGTDKKRYKFLELWALERKRERKKERKKERGGRSVLKLEITFILSALLSLSLSLTCPIIKNLSKLKKKSVKISAFTGNWTHNH